MEWVVITAILWIYMGQSSGAAAGDVMGSFGSNFNAFVVVGPLFALLFLYLGFTPPKQI